MTERHKERRRKREKEKMEKRDYSFQLRKNKKFPNGNLWYRRWRNHLWHSQQEEDREIAVEKARSFMMHVVGQHEWQKVK